MEDAYWSAGFETRSRGSAYKLEQREDVRAYIGVLLERETRATEIEAFELRSAALRHAKESFEKLVELMRSAKSEHVQLRAAVHILDRTFGRVK